MKMENYLIGLSEISDLEHLKNFFLSEASSFGATHVAGYPLMYGEGGENLVPYVSDFSDEIRAAYQKYAASQDPFMEAALVQGGPVQYTQVRDRLIWDEVQVGFFNRLYDLRLMDGVGSPVSPKPGVVAYFVMTFTEERPPMDWAELRRVHIYFSEFFARYWELTKSERPHISTRERQILIGIMKGKSKTEISETLGLSVHTVDTYTRRCFEKLEAKNRTEAAIKAFGLGLAYTDSINADGKI